MLFCAVTALLVAYLPNVLACPQHDNYIAPSHSIKRQQTTIETGRRETFWRYDASYDWGKISPDYGWCQNGTRQSPIALARSFGLSNYHQPSFAGYEGKSMTGEFYNWGHGPAFTVYHAKDEFSSLPSMTFDDETVYLIGWHIHSPADHTVDGHRSKSELHLVHADVLGKPRSVVAIRIDPGRANSTFFDDLPHPYIGFNETISYENVELDLMEPIREVQELQEFWTYKGSLTSPPCEEGIRWFVARTILYTGPIQQQSILHVSTYSARVEQEVWQHEINV